MAPTKVLFFGVTGYAGGTVLTKLFLDRDSDEEVTVLVRSPQKAEKLKKYGVTPVVGSLGDAELIEKLVSESDIVINVADSYDVEFTKNILRGLQKRYERTGIKPPYIYTTGNGSLIDNSGGNTVSDLIYDDTNIEQMASIPLDAIHREADLAVINADEEGGYCRSYLVMPAIIWGEPKTKLVKDGIQNPHTVAFPTIANVMFDIGQSCVAGKGVSMWNHVENGELADLFVILYDAIRADPDGTRVGHGKDGYYHGENGEWSWMQLAEAMGQALHTLDPSKPAEVRSYTPEEQLKHPLTRVWGNNARSVANHSKSLGWKPKLTTTDFLNSALTEVERWVKDGKPLESQLAQMSK